MNSVDLRKQLYSIQYQPFKEKATEFWDKFEEIIRVYNTIPSAPPLTQQEIRDAFYQAIEKHVPQVHQLEFVNQSLTKASLSYEDLKRFLIQHEAAKRADSRQAFPPVAQRTPGAQAMAVNSYAETRCYHCDDLGHIAKDCGRANLPGRRCYNCHKFVTDHVAANCPAFRRDDHSKPGGSKRYENSFRRGNKSSGGGNNNNNNNKR